jgi:hypothetical protein
MHSLLADEAAAGHCAVLAASVVVASPAGRSAQAAREHEGAAATLPGMGESEAELSGCLQSAVSCALISRPLSMVFRCQPALFRGLPNALSLASSSLFSSVQRKTARSNKQALVHLYRGRVSKSFQHWVQMVSVAESVYRCWLSCRVTPESFLLMFTACTALYVIISTRLRESLCR